MSYHGLVYTEAFGKAAYIVKARVQLMRDIGAQAAPMNAFLLGVGIETLPLRMERHSSNALAVLNRLYAEGKDMGALLDELACLTRDLMILKTAPREGISMLSRVATDEDVKSLVQNFSSGELVRMMNLLQQTISGFTRSVSRRLDAELCIMNLCQPELDTDSDAIIARLTKVEDQLKSGMIFSGEATVKPKMEERAPTQESIDESVPNTDPADDQGEEISTQTDTAPVDFGQMLRQLSEAN
jgi:DNA polymerase-3 subunit gamma/tau